MIRPAGRLQVGVLDRHPGPLADLDRLGVGLEQGGGLAPDVRAVRPAGAAQHLGEGDQLIGLGVEAGE